VAVGEGISVGNATSGVGLQAVSR